MPDFDTLLQDIAACTRCDLHKTRTMSVPGEGSRTAQIMIIGEAPGFNEDKQGRPFVGQAGNVLNRMLASIGLKREDVYITNMVKSRPPENRDPLPAEIEACRPFLDRQIELIRPKVIVCLGRHSFGKFFPGELISKSRGKARKYKDMIVYPMYHPAATLHNPGLLPALEADFKKLKDLLDARPQAPTPPATKPTQLALQPQPQAVPQKADAPAAGPAAEKKPKQLGLF
ncbi:MAG: uracil-DNA glycosylase [SAR202 cluster bacterium]|nr:uracil-DNA glycosylase [SAR202 cluster bacterium]